MANTISNGYSFATWTNFIEESQIRSLLKYKVKYYFAGGKPGIIPTDIFADIMADLSVKYKENPKLALEDLNYSGRHLPSGSMIPGVFTLIMKRNGKMFLSQMGHSKRSMHY
jgi:hypothetical protein